MRMISRKAILLPLAVAGILVAASAVAGEKVDVELTVYNWAKVARKAAPVTAGVPLPMGAVSDVKQLQIVDAGGKVVPAQFRVLDRWWREKHMKLAKTPSLRWVLCDFQADVAAGGTAKFKLQSVEKAPEHKSRLSVAETADAVTVITGPLKFVVSKKQFKVINQAWLDANGDGKFAPDEEVIAAGKESGGVLRPTDWPDGGCKAGQAHYSGTRPATVTVLEQGPTKVTLRIEGRHYAPSGGAPKGMYGYQVYMTAWAGRAEVEVQYGITNTHIEETGQNKYQMWAWPIQSAEMRLDLKGGGAGKALILGTDAKRLDHKSGADINAKGAIGMSNGKLGAALAMRDFGPNFPKALRAAKDHLAIEFFPKGEKHYWISAKCRKNHRMLLEFFKGDPDKARLEALVAKAQAPLRMLPTDPAWFWKTHGWDAGLGPHPRHKRGAPGAAWNKARDRYKGWNKYGYVGEFNGGGMHWNFKTVFWKYAVAGSRSAFEHAESRALYFNDMVPIHTPRNRWKVMEFVVTPEKHRAKSNYARSHTKISVKKFPGYKVHRGNTPDAGHMSQFQLYEYYRLTGDWATLDSIESEGFRGAYAEAYKRVYGSYGSWKRQKGPADLKRMCAITYGARYIGWPIFVMMEAYGFTGNENYLYPAKLYAYGLFNQGRRSPHGYMSPVFHTKNDGGYGKSFIGRWKKNHPGKPVPASMCTAPFQVGIGLRGLHKYWQETGDPNIRDALIMGAVHLEQIAARQGENYSGWQYVWADYWGSGRLSKGVFTSSAGEMPGAVAYGYLVSGRPKLLKLVQDSAKVHSRSGDERIFAIFEAIWSAKNEDRKRPAGITDLKAEALGGGKVKLTWTAPGDDGKQGQAAEYAVKHASAPIVDFVGFWDQKKKTGWPDMTGAIPTTPAEYYKKSAEFSAKKRVSFWCLHNQADPPKPGKAGTSESMTLEKVPAGKRFFAVVAFDEMPNAAPLSNEAAVEVK
jgi:hypothetical protein